MPNVLPDSIITRDAVQGTPIIRTWHVVALAKRNASQAAEAFRYFMLEKGAELLTKSFPNI